MRHLLLSSVSILAGVFAGQAIAQPARPVQNNAPMTATTSNSAPAARSITLGQTVTGTIGPEDAKLESDNSSYEVYRVQIPAGRRVTATLTSSAFQPVLAMGPNVDEQCEDCLTGSGETNKAAVVSRVMEEAGTLEVRVNTMSEGERGPFTLTVVANVPPALATQPIVFGQSKTGALTTTDAMSGDDNALTDAYALRLTANQQVQIDLSSSEFDAKLELIGPNGTKISDDDDSGPGNNARIRFTAPRVGVYQIRAMALNESGIGAYTLRAGSIPPVVAMPAPRPLTLGTATAGAISATTPRYENEGEETIAVRYSFNAVGGAVYRIEATKANGSTLDPRIAVGKLSNGVFEATESDDDGGGEMNAAMRFRPTRSGVYVVEVSPVGETMGNFTVKATQSPPDRAAGNPVPVRFGTDTKGSLSDGGSRSSDDLLFNNYSVALKAGQRVVVHVKKDGESTLDPKVEIGRGTSAAFESLGEDDDGGADLNARLRFVAPSDGTFVIRAIAASANSVGNYVLRIDEALPPVTPPAPTPIQLGQQVQGSLATTDPLLNDTTYYDRFVFSGQVGETFEIRVNSEPVDVIVGARSSLREDDDYVTDDDNGGGTNAKLDYTITTAGPQTIRVTSIGDEAVGAYTIVITKK